MGRRTSTVDPLARHDHLRSPRQGTDSTSRGRAARLARYISRPYGTGGGRSSQASRGHPTCTVADPRVTRLDRPARSTRDLLNIVDDGAEECFFERAPDRAVAGTIDNAEFYDLVLQQPQGPACASLGRLGTGQGDQLGLLLAVKNPSNGRHRARLAA